MEKKKLCLNTRLVCADAAGVIDALAEGLKERCLRIQKGDETLVLTPPEAVDLELEARLKDGRGKITLEISWRVSEDGEHEADDGEDDEPGQSGASGEARPDDEAEVLIDAAEITPGEGAAQAMSDAPAVKEGKDRKSHKRKS